MKPKVSWQAAIIIAYLVGLIVFTFSQTILGGIALTGIIGFLATTMHSTRVYQDKEEVDFPSK